MERLEDARDPENPVGIDGIHSALLHLREECRENDVAFACYARHEDGSMVSVIDGMCAAEVSLAVVGLLETVKKQIPDFDEICFLEALVMAIKVTGVMRRDRERRYN